MTGVAWDALIIVAFLVVLILVLGSLGFVIACIVDVARRPGVAYEQAAVMGRRAWLWLFGCLIPAIVVLPFLASIAALAACLVYWLSIRPKLISAPHAFSPVADAPGAGEG